MNKHIIYIMIITVSLQFNIYCRELNIAEILQKIQKNEQFQTIPVQKETMVPKREVNSKSKKDSKFMQSIENSKELQKPVQGDSRIEKNKALQTKAKSAKQTRIIRGQSIKRKQERSNTYLLPVYYNMKDKGSVKNIKSKQRAKSRKSEQLKIKSKSGKQRAKEKDESYQQSALPTINRKKTRLLKSRLKRVDPKFLLESVELEELDRIKKLRQETNTEPNQDQDTKTTPVKQFPTIKSQSNTKKHNRKEHKQRIPTLKSTTQEGDLIFLQSGDIEKNSELKQLDANKELRQVKSKIEHDELKSLLLLFLDDLKIKSASTKKTKTIKRQSQNKYDTEPFDMGYTMKNLANHGRKQKKRKVRSDEKYFTLQEKKNLKNKIDNDELDLDKMKPGKLENKDKKEGPKNQFKIEIKKRHSEVNHDVDIKQSEKDFDFQEGRIPIKQIESKNNKNLDADIIEKLGNQSEMAMNKKYSKVKEELDSQLKDGEKSSKSFVLQERLQKKESLKRLHSFQMANKETDLEKYIDSIEHIIINSLLMGKLQLNKNITYINTEKRQKNKTQYFNFRRKIKTDKSGKEKLLQIAEDKNKTLIKNQSQRTNETIKIIVRKGIRFQDLWQSFSKNKKNKNVTKENVKEVLTLKTNDNPDQKDIHKIQRQQTKNDHFVYWWLSRIPGKTTTTATPTMELAEQRKRLGQLEDTIKNRIKIVEEREDADNGTDEANYQNHMYFLYASRLAECEAPPRPYMYPYYPPPYYPMYG